MAVNHSLDVEYSFFTKRAKFEDGNFTIREEITGFEYGKSKEHCGQTMVYLAVSSRKPVYLSIPLFTTSSDFFRKNAEQQKFYSTLLDDITTIQHR